MLNDSCRRSLVDLQQKGPRTLVYIDESGIDNRDTYDYGADWKRRKVFRFQRGEKECKSKYNSSFQSGKIDSSTHFWRVMQSGDIWKMAHYLAEKNWQTQGGCALRRNAHAHKGFPSHLLSLKRTPIFYASPLRRAITVSAVAWSNNYSRQCHFS